MGNAEDKFQEQKQQQLTRSFSLDIPMELRRAHFSLPAINDLEPRERLSLNHPRIKANAGNRLSLSTKAQQRQVKGEETRLTFLTLLIALELPRASRLDTLGVLHPRLRSPGHLLPEQRADRRRSSISCERSP